MLCDRCYPYPRRLVANQLRLTPYQCRCDVCASGPPDTSESNPPPISDYISCSLGWAVVPVAPSTSGQGASTGSMGSTGADQPPTETSAQPLPQIVIHPRNIVDVGCNCHHDHHRGGSCTTRRRIQFGYLTGDSENALLCEVCYPQPRQLVANQIRLTPCQCRCKIWAPEPPATPEPSTPPISDSLGWAATQVAPSDVGQEAPTETIGPTSTDGSSMSQADRPTQHTETIQHSIIGFDQRPMRASGLDRDDMEEFITADLDGALRSGKSTSTDDLWGEKAEAQARFA